VRRPKMKKPRVYFSTRNLYQDLRDRMRIVSHKYSGTMEWTLNVALSKGLRMMEAADATALTRHVEVAPEERRAKPTVEDAWREDPAPELAKVLAKPFEAKPPKRPRPPVVDDEEEDGRVYTSHEPDDAP